MSEKRLVSWSVAVVSTVVTAFLVGYFVVPRVSGSELEETNELIAQYIEYQRTIRLSPDQEAIKKEALEALPAPCCSDNNAYTCCCPCNLSRAVWGLSADLIVNQGADARSVRQAAKDWIERIGPDGFSGDVCYTGGCGRAMHKNGCGGMNPDALVLN